MTDISTRRVSISRESLGSYLATNDKGAQLRFGASTEGTFSPVELLLAAVAGCSGMDLDYITSRRAEPLRFDAVSEAEYIKDDTGNILRDIRVTFTLEFPEGAEGDRARDRIESALRSSHDKTCTVSRTIEQGTTVTLLGE